LGWLSILTLTGISFGVTAWLVIRYNLSIYPFDTHWSDYAYWAYSKPYTRVPAYFVGIIAAWLLDDMEKRGITREARSHSLRVKIGATIAAVLSWGVLLFLVFIVVTDFGDHKDSWGHVASVMYIVLSRPLWAMCWAVITLLCYYDLAPWTNAFLAHRCWTPLARLTYGAYLVHPLVIKLVSGRALQYFTFNSWDLTYRTVGNFIMAYTGSFVFWCLIERPCMTIFSPAKKPSRAKSAPASESSKNSTPDAALPSTISDGNAKVDGFCAEPLKSSA
jgi:peptidoglycan/LPS O-acetylase OafA/YrhL